MLVQAATGFVAPTKNAWLSLRLRSSDGGTVEDDAVEGAVSELRAYTPEDGERATQEQLDAAEAEKHAEAQPKEEAAETDADARAAAEADAKLKKPVRDEPKTRRLKTEEDAGLAVAERRRALQAEAQRVADVKAAEQAERDAAGTAASIASNAAKFAVRGFTESLRQEMLVARYPVQVTCVHPGGIKTGIARNAARGKGFEDGAAMERFDRQMLRMSPEKAAEVILTGVRRNRGRVLVGNDAKVLDVLVRVLGSAYQRPFSMAAGRGLR